MARALWFNEPSTEEFHRVVQNLTHMHINVLLHKKIVQRKLIASDLQNALKGTFFLHFPACLALQVVSHSELSCRG